MIERAILGFAFIILSINLKRLKPDTNGFISLIQTQKHLLKRIIIKPLKIKKKMKKYLLLFVAAGLFAVGCKTEDPQPQEETYDATINILSPADGAMGMVGEEMSIEVELDRPDNKIIHNLSVIIEDADGNVVEKIIDNEHVHAEGHHHVHEHFHPMSHGSYVLRVVTTDHEDANKKVEATRSFMVMDAASYDVTIDIQDPVENLTAAINDVLAVKVVYTHDHGGTIHHVKIEVQDDGGNVVATLFDHHAHVEGTYTFDDVDAYTADTAGTFKIVARTMNMDMSIMKMAERTFTVQ